MPRSFAVSSRTSTGVAQSLEWSVCMWRSQSIVRRREIRRRTSGLPRRVVAARDHPPVEVLQLVAELSASGRSEAPAFAIRAAQAASLGSRRSSCPASVIASPGGKTNPHSPVVGDELLVGIDLRRRPGRRRRRTPSGSATAPGAARPRRRRRRRLRRAGRPARRRAGRRIRTRSRRARLSRGVATDGSSIQTSASQGEVERQPAQRPQQQPQRPALLARDVDDPRRRRRPSADGGRPRPAASGSRRCPGKKRAEQVGGRSGR